MSTPGRARRVSPHLLLASLLSVPALWISSRVGLSADVSIGSVLGVMVVALVCTLSVQLLLPGAQSGWRLTVRVGVQMALGKKGAHVEFKEQSGDTVASLGGCFFDAEFS